MESSVLIRYLGDSPKPRIIDLMLHFPLNDFTKKEILEEIGISKHSPMVFQNRGDSVSSRCP